MKIYFAGSIRGGRDDAPLYHEIIALLTEYGDVLTEHIGDIGLTAAGEDGLPDATIYERDMGWLAEADAVIAEVTVASLGVGTRSPGPRRSESRCCASTGGAPGDGYRPCWRATPRCGARCMGAWRRSSRFWSGSCAVE